MLMFMLQIYYYFYQLHSYLIIKNRKMERNKFSDTTIFYFYVFSTDYLFYL